MAEKIIKPGRKMHAAGLVWLLEVPAVLILRLGGLVLGGRDTFSYRSQSIHQGKARLVWRRSKVFPGIEAEEGVLLIPHK